MITRSNRSSSTARAGAAGSARVSSLREVGVVDAVQEHVHLGDRPGSAVVLLAEQGQVAGVAAVLLDVLAWRRISMPPEPEQGS